MKGHRTCILCLPRSGSQLCERLVSEIQDASPLNEYFENWNQSEYVLDANNFIQLRQFNKIPSYYKITPNFEEKLDLLKRVNINQPLVLRIFIMDHYSKDDLRKIILELHNIGFEFITLFRELRAQLLSYMVARSYQSSKNESVFEMNSAIAEPIKIDFNHNLYIPLYQIKNSSINWSKNLSFLLDSMSVNSVYYETIYSDMEQLYQTKFKYLGNKSIKSDPLELILNKTEVLNFLGK